MLVLVCGSRAWQDSQAIADRFAKYPRGTVVLHGGASRGADYLASLIAKTMGFSQEVMPADWRRLGRGAGIIRNGQMLDRNPDVVLAFWDGSSPGTRHTIKEARRRGIPVEVVGGSH